MYQFEFRLLIVLSRRRDSGLGLKFVQNLRHMAPYRFFSFHFASNSKNLTTRYTFSYKIHVTWIKLIKVFPLSFYTEESWI